MLFGYYNKSCGETNREQQDQLVLITLELAVPYVTQRNWHVTEIMAAQQVQIRFLILNCVNCLLFEDVSGSDFSSGSHHLFANILILLSKRKTIFMLTVGGGHYSRKWWPLWNKG
jgi:hypothetical protein